MSRPRYVAVENPPGSAFIHCVMDTKTNRPAATVADKESAATVAGYMNEADARARKDVQPYIDIVDNLARVVMSKLPGGSGVP